MRPRRRAAPRARRRRRSSTLGVGGRGRGLVAHDASRRPSAARATTRRRSRERGRLGQPVELAPARRAPARAGCAATSPGSHVASMRIRSGQLVPARRISPITCWPRANGTSDDSTAIPRSADRRVEQLGLLGAERVEEADRRRRGALAAARGERDQQASSAIRTTPLTLPRVVMRIAAVRSMTGFGRGVAEHGARARDRRHPRRQPSLPRPQAARRPLSPALEDAISTRVRSASSAARSRSRSTSCASAAPARRASITAPPRAAHAAARRARAHARHRAAPISRSCSRSPASSSRPTRTARRRDTRRVLAAARRPRSPSSPAMRDGEGQALAARAARAARRARRAAQHAREARRRRRRARADAAARAPAAAAARRGHRQASRCGRLARSSAARPRSRAARRPRRRHRGAGAAREPPRAGARARSPARRGRPPSRLPRAGDRPRAQHDRQQVRGRGDQLAQSSRQRRCSRRCANRSRTWNDARPMPRQSRSTGHRVVAIWCRQDDADAPAARGVRGPARVLASRTRRARCARRGRRPRLLVRHARARSSGWSRRGEFAEHAYVSSATATARRRRRSRRRWPPAAT